MLQDFPNFVNSQLASSCIFLATWPLSAVLLKNTQLFPWLILVPSPPNVTEINQLNQTQRYALMDEIKAASDIMQRLFNPDKLNVGSLGNIVPQLHIHVVGRFSDDALWPSGIWQSHKHEEKAFDNPALLERLKVLTQQHFKD